jgi:hypothetical protein
MQNGHNVSQLLFRPLAKFGNKLQKFFYTQIFSFDQILYHFVSFMAEIFCSAWVSQLPRQVGILRVSQEDSTTLKHKDTQYNSVQHMCSQRNDTQHLSWVPLFLLSYVLSAAIKSIMLSVIMLNVVESTRPK